jgi:hypothetical protein
MKIRFHIFFVALVAVLVGLVFLDEPKFGDDFTYWMHAFNVHEHGIKAFSKESFHQLRWPVWGLCWVLQAMFGPGLISYYGAPYLYLALGAICAFLAGWKLFARTPLAWACSLAFLFHPLLDTLVARPMPDLSEGVFAAFAVFGWWGLMQSESRQGMWLCGLASGVSIFLAHENRLTGLFIIPLLGCLTLLFFPRRVLRLSIPFACFAVLLAAQMAFYKFNPRFGSWFHYYEANAGAKGRKGTESAMLWKLPFRFLDTLSKGGVLAPFYAVFAGIGCFFAWRRYGKFGRVILAWFVLLYLAYACAPQQIWPYRPLLRDADRFLAALAIPYGALAIMGIAGLFQIFGKRMPPLAVLSRRPLVTSLVCFGLLIVSAGQPLGDRGFFTLSYVHEFREHMRALPDATRIFTHGHMRALAFLIDADSARRLTWNSSDKWIIDSEPALEATAAQSDEFWYVRKLAMLRTFKEIKAHKQPTPLPLASYFDEPEKHWQLARVLTKDDTPDIVLYRKRTAATPSPIILNATAPELASLLPQLPGEWKKPSSKTFEWKIPESLRGKKVRIEAALASDDGEPFTVKVVFIVHGKEMPAYLLKPYVFKVPRKDFFALPIPADAESCSITIKVEKGTEMIRADAFRLIAE